MTVLSPLRRLGLSVVAVAASATLVTACSSSTSGNPIGGLAGNSSAVTSAPTGGSSSSGGLSVGGASTSAKAPVASSAAVTTSGGGGGNSKAAFCAQLQTLGSDIGTAGAGGNVSAIADKFQKLADAAPDEIKPDLEKMATYLKDVAGGKLPDASTTAEYSAAAQKVVQYLTTACI